MRILLREPVRSGVFARVPGTQALRVGVAIPATKKVRNPLRATGYQAIEASGEPSRAGFLKHSWRVHRLASCKECLKDNSIALLQSWSGLTARQGSESWDC